MFHANLDEVTILHSNTCLSTQLYATALRKEKKKQPTDLNEVTSSL